MELSGEMPDRSNGDSYLRVAPLEAPNPFFPDRGSRLWVFRATVVVRLLVFKALSERGKVTISQNATMLTVPNEFQQHF